MTAQLRTYLESEMSRRTGMDPEIETQLKKLLAQEEQTIKVLLVLDGEDELPPQVVIKAATARVLCCVVDRNSKAPLQVLINDPVVSKAEFDGAVYDELAVEIQTGIISVQKIMEALDRD